MSDLGSANWSETDASNNATPPNGWPEGMNPSDVNNSARANMGGLKRWWDRNNSVKTTAGTTTAYTLTYDVAAASYYDGEEFSFIVNATCGGAPTLSINGIGARQIRKFTAGAFANLAALDIVANQPIRVRYNLGATTFDIITPPVGDYLTAATTAAMTAAINEAKGADIASATTTDIGAATGNFVHVTGTTTITGLGTVQAGTERTVEFTGALILTHNATSLILPGAANITTVAGDCAVFRSEGSGNWRCVVYTMAGTLRYTNSATSDTPLNSAGNYFTAATVAQGSGGVWEAAAGASFGGSSIDAQYFAKLWDGTTVIDSRAITVAAGGYASISLFGALANPAGNLRIEVRNPTAVDGSLVFNRSGNSKDCTITARRIA